MALICNTNKKRTELQKTLLDNNIQTLIHYPIPPHKQEAYKNWNIMNYPKSETIHDEILSLPISPEITNNEIKFIVKVINTIS